MIPDHLPSGWLTQGEAEFLSEIASLAYGPILEVGCFRGRSTVILASFGRPVYSVDPFSNFAKADLSGSTIEAEFLENTKHLPNVHLFKMKIEEWAPKPCGLCYLDGDHTYTGTINQIKIALQCGPNIIAVHDVNDKGGGLQVKNACLGLLGHWKRRVERIAKFRIK